MRLSLLWRLGLSYLALVAATLVAVELAAPEATRRTLPALLAIFLAGGIVLFILLRSTASRIRHLAEFTSRVAAGNFTAIGRDHGVDELSQLSDALNRTLPQLGQTIQTLSDERNRSSAILESMIEGVAVVGGDERILYCNAAFEQILELPEGSSQGRKLVEALREAELVAAVRQVLVGGEEVTGEVEVGTVRRRSFSVTAAPVHADGPSGAVLVLHDITGIAPARARASGFRRQRFA